MAKQKPFIGIATGMQLSDLNGEQTWR